MPLLDETSPQFFIAGKKPVNALVGLDDQGMQYARKQAADWVLIERVPGEYVDDPLKNVLSPEFDNPNRYQIAASNPVPRSGWWFTPAKANSRRYFKEGDVFPDFPNNDYGHVFWQWSPDQTHPHL
ncbi:hypothetical protein CO611_09120 [Lysobacteraceae bacterium NML03-0222]|nr:hypothetical protein CO611_09120 [Xanthomonadaceae bacterium NML03-0222]